MDKVEKLADIKAKVLEDVNIDMQHNLNKKTAKERISGILDEGSFIEVGGMNGKNGGGIIGGYGTIDGRLTFVCSHDYTVEGGALNRRNAAKICRIMDMALEMGAPIVQIYDSIGADVSEGLEVLESYGKILKKNAELAGVVPHISVIAGPTKGMDAVGAGMSDFVFIVENSGELSLSSDMAVSKSEGIYIDKKELASAKVASDNGSAQIAVCNEVELFEKIKKLIGYMPSNNKSLSPIGDECNDVNSGSEKLNEIVNSENVEVQDVLNEILDRNSAISINKNFEENCSTVLGRMNGLTTGVITIDNKKGISSATCEKISRFAKVCDNFNIPMVTIVNSRGFVCDLEEEQKGLSTMASKLIASLAVSDVGKVSLIVGDAVGASFLAFASKELAFDMVYAWPSAKISAQDPVEAIKRDFADEITGSEIPKKAESRIIDEKIGEYTNPYNAASEGIIDEVIEPSETRARICGILDMLQSKRVLKYPRKHGSHLI